MRFSDIFDHTVLSLAGQIDEGMIQLFERTLKTLWMDTRLEKKLTITLTTFGGASGYALGMYERLRLAQRDFDIRIVGCGIVYSHGVSMMMALPKVQRFLTAGTRVYIHEMQKEMALSLTGPQNARRQVLEQERRTFEEEQLVMAWVVRALHEGTGQPEALVRERMSTGHYMGGAEAVDFGIAGALLEET
jgi:ATP-dependent protease ClpP protease subunit